MASEPRIILFDIESLPDLREVLKIFPSLSEYPGKTLKATINSIICFGYQVFGEHEQKIINAWDFPSWDEHVNNDKSLCEAAREVLNGADAVVTHNGRSFDWKFFQTRLLKHGLDPLHKIPHIDTKTLAKSNLFLYNNRLNTLAKTFTSEEKLENGGWELWEKVHQRDPDAMALMSLYCKQDVKVLNEVFKKLRPFATNIPNYNLFGAHERPLCSSCGSTRIHKSGTRVLKTKIVQRFRCNDCGSSMFINKDGELPRFG